LKNRVPFSVFDELLYKNNKDSIKYNQNKWFKSLENGSITIKEQVYTLNVTENKRKLIWNNDGLLVSTKPYVLEIVNNENIIKDD
jgi:hypothetical protein